MNTINDFKFGDLVTWKGYDDSYPVVKMVVVAVQPDNGIGGSIVCFKDKANDWIPIVACPNELNKLKRE